MGMPKVKLLYSHAMGFDLKLIELELVPIDLLMYGNIFPTSGKIDGNTHIFPTHGFREIFPV